MRQGNGGSRTRRGQRAFVDRLYPVDIEGGVNPRGFWKPQPNRGWSDDPLDDEGHHESLHHLPRFPMETKVLRGEPDSVPPDTGLGGKAAQQGWPSLGPHPLLSQRGALPLFTFVPREASATPVPRPSPVLVPRGALPASVSSGAPPSPTPTLRGASFLPVLRGAQPLPVPRTFPAPTIAPRTPPAHQPQRRLVF